MANGKFNINEKVSYGIHRPVSVNGKVKYRRMDTYYTGSNPQQPIPNWKDWNSPSNIKSIIVTTSYIGVEFWVPYVGSTCGKLMMVSTGLKSECQGESNLSTLLEDKLNYQDNVGKEHGVKITGLPFQPLHGSWICGNVVNILFDEVAILSTSLNRSCDNIIGVCIDAIRNGKVIKEGSVGAKILKDGLGNFNIDKFEMLQNVVFIQGLGLGLSALATDQAKKTIGAVLEQGSFDKLAEEITKSTGGGVSSIVKRNARKEITIQEGVWKFDGRLKGLKSTPRIDTTEKMEEVAFCREMSNIPAEALALALNTSEMEKKTLDNISILIGKKQPDVVKFIQILSDYVKNSGEKVLSSNRPLLEVVKKFGNSK